jgi:hypothetical protein
MVAVRTSETSVDNHFTRQYIPEDNSEQTRNPLQFSVSAGQHLQHESAMAQAVRRQPFTT